MNATTQAESDVLELAPVESRLDALVIVAAEARNTPWAHDQRPPPKPLTAGCIHDGEKK